MGSGQELHVPVICNKGSAEVESAATGLITAAGPKEENPWLIPCKQRQQERKGTPLATL